MKERGGNVGPVVKRNVIGSGAKDFLNPQMIPPNSTPVAYQTWHETNPHANEFTKTVKAGMLYRLTKVLYSTTDQAGGQLIPLQSICEHRSQRQSKTFAAVNKCMETLI